MWSTFSQREERVASRDFSGAYAILDEKFSRLRGRDLSNANWSVYAFTQWIANPVTLKRQSSGSYLRICPAIPIASPKINSKRIRY